MTPGTLAIVAGACGVVLAAAGASIRKTNPGWGNFAIGLGICGLSGFVGYFVY